MRPDDKRWAFGVALGVGLFFALVMLAGRLYLKNIDDSYVLRMNQTAMHGDFTLWMLRNDSKGLPIRINPPLESRSSFARGKIYIQREYISPRSTVSLQIRTAGRFELRSTKPPDEAYLDVRVFHAKVPGHRPVIVVGPNPNMSRTTELYLDEIHPELLLSKRYAIDSEWSSSPFSRGVGTKIHMEIFNFTGSDDFWKIEVFDSVTNKSVSFNGMALFKVKFRLALRWEGEGEIRSEWLETEFFAVELVE